MRISRFFLAIAASLLMLQACAPSMEEKAAQAINEVMAEFQNVGIAAVAVKDGKIAIRSLFFCNCARNGVYQIARLHILVVAKLEADL